MWTPLCSQKKSLPYLKHIRHVKSQCYIIYFITANTDDNARFTFTPFLFDVDFQVRALGINLEKICFEFIFSRVVVIADLMMARLAEQDQFVEIRIAHFRTKFINALKSFFV